MSGSAAHWWPWTESWSPDAPEAASPPWPGSWPSGPGCLCSSGTRWAFSAPRNTAQPSATWRRLRAVLDGAPYYADELVYGAADTVIFLDYPKLVVMCRVLRRTLMIELTGRPSGAHRRQGLVAWRDPEHPVRWAWISHRDRHLEGLALTARPELRNAQIIRFTRPVMARRWLSQL